jgi:hypothetical protein
MWQGRELLGTIFVRWRRKPGHNYYYLLGFLFLILVGLHCYYIMDEWHNSVSPCECNDKPYIESSSLVLVLQLADEAHSKLTKYYLICWWLVSHKPSTF